MALERKVNIKFEKVSYGQFYDAYKNLNQELFDDVIGEMYDELKLPTRSTTGSAGYDFKSPFAFSLAAGETILIPTGIRAIMPESVVLMVFPRSGLGFKFREQMDNTVGIIDSDYQFSDNEGHIMLKVTNDSKTNKMMEVERGKGFAQGIFLPYLVTDDDAATGTRNGGFGSTDSVFIPQMSLTDEKPACDGVLTTAYTTVACSTEGVLS